MADNGAGSPSKCYFRYYHRPHTRDRPRCRRNRADTLYCRCILSARPAALYIRSGDGATVPSVCDVNAGSKRASEDAVGYGIGSTRVGTRYEPCCGDHQNAVKENEKMVVSEVETNINVAQPGRSEVSRTPMRTISVRNFNVWYGSFYALKNINIEIPIRDITALIGPSGCGKSTFLRSINRMNDLIPSVKTSGEIWIDGHDVAAADTDVVSLRKNTGMVFQRPNPFPKSIFDNVAYGPRIHGVMDRSQLAEIVEKSLIRAAIWDEVKDALHKSAFDLSGGQQQRLCIARALAVEPEIILMDEPASALDPISTLKIEELMHELKKDITIVIVTHNMQQAARVSSFTGFFLMGELIEFAESNVIFTRPTDKRTEDYVTGRFG